MKHNYFLLLFIIILTSISSSAFSLAPSADLGVVSLDSPTTPMCADKPNLIVTIKNYSANKHNFAVDNAVITVNITGASTNTYTLSVMTGTLAAGGTAQFTVASPIDLRTAGNHFFDARIDVLTGDADNSNDALPTVDVKVHPLPTVTLTAFSAVCLNTPAFTLSGGSPAGGIYSGSGVSGGIFTASSAGTGNKTINYIYTDGNGCAASAQKTITVRPLPTVIHSTLSSVCADLPSFSLSGGSPIGGTYSGTGVSGGAFDPAVAGPGTFTVTYMYTDGNGCSSSASPTQTVNALPSVTFGQVGYVCINGTAITLTSGSPTGGTYSGTNVSGGSFDPSISAAIGTFTLDYSYTDGNGCSSVATQTVDVYDIPTVTHSALSDVCEGSDTIILSGGTPTGGTYTGTGISMGSFVPTLSGPGTFTLTYSYTDGNGCSNETSPTITVNPTPVVTLGSLPAVCDNVMTFSLSGGSPSGGVFSGTGVNGGMFDPAAATAGNHVISYIYIDPTTTCTDTARQTITVHSSPVVDLGNDTAICESSIILDAGNSGATYLWSTGATTQTINTLTSDTIDVMVTDANNCMATDTVEFIYQPLPTIALTLTTTFVCINDPAITLSGGSPAGGSYSGTAVSGGMFTPSTAGGGNHVIVYTYIDPLTGCSDTAENTITVGCTGIAALEAENVFFLRNDAFNNTISVIINGSVTETVSLSVSDVQGKTLYTETLNTPNSGGTTTINTASFADGLYFVSLKTTAGHYSQKVFVQH